MRSEGPDVLQIEEGMPVMSCRHCHHVFEVGEEAIEVKADLFCSEDCCIKHEAMLEDKYWDTRFDEFRSGGW